VSMEGVRVNYNSEKPAQLHALAFAHGRDIHLAPGQEKHLPHEAWHVAQQQQGRVPTTRQLKGMGLNDDAALEREADVMGTRAANFQGEKAAPRLAAQGLPTPAIQLVVDEDLKEGVVVKILGGNWKDKYAMIVSDEQDEEKNEIGYRVKVIDNNEFNGWELPYSFIQLDPADPDAIDYPDVRNLVLKQ
jgi:hypothetical protein